ncbi:ribonuclease D [Methylovulum psychrotolerans]|uniref:Ribonuclease D n=1 Tax=Methylovulum psychrotolerans TaxID=1704499 RepID=A0A1Z4BZS4_9GAMM|nr:ribonuclease D [Methylovulum psychrotolerans]ASF46773.1 ribonuclease D [Methylovulum psychrotolerans]POZ50766.1 ribonuclease D [Methylovulum psychrotolerans]
MTTINYINTPDKLTAVCALIRDSAWLALDTEFLREKTYYPKFCLLQIATPEWVACIDPLALPDLDELFTALENPAIVKVFHSCRQDLEIFYQLRGKLPAPIFDTQVAAPLLGYQDNPGYAMLVSSLLNINLSKAHTRADWSKRPLTEAQIEYAADDVIYLCQIYQIMLQKLAELGRADWLKQDFAELSNPDVYAVDPAKAWLKIKGKNKLSGRQLAIIQAISEWREKMAQQEDRPKSWLLRDELLFDIAKLQPETSADLAAVRGINENVVRRYGKELCQLISAAKNQPPIPLHNDGRAAKKTQQQEAILDILTALVRIRAEENLLNPSILASRKDLEDLLLLEDDNDCPLLHGWRYAMAGEELLGLLKGELLLGIQADKLAIIQARP